MSEKISVQITATDGASTVFQQVASGAEKLDQSLDRVGDGFQDLAKDSQATTRSLRDLDVSYRDIGASLGILATGVALAGRSFRDQEVALRTLERGYGDAAEQLIAFSEAIQDNTNFSNDQAIAAANTFRTLADNYGFTTAQIQELISISADLAATMGIGLEDAAFRVQSAMRGEAEAAEYLGLTLNDRALGLDRVSASMSEAERAQVRFNALQEQSAFALGTAAEQADTTYGAMTQLKDSVQDAAQAFGEFIGPVGEIGAFAADNAVQIAAMGLALGQLGKTAASAGKALGPVSVGTTTLGAAAGPAAGKILALAAAAGLLYVGYQALTDKGDFLPQSFDAIAEGAENAEEAISALAAAGDTLSVSLGQSAQNALSSFGDDMREMLRLSGEQATFQPGRASAEQQAAHEANMARLRELEAQYGHWSTSAQNVADAETALLAVLTNSGTGRDLALEGLRKLNEEFEKGNISPETYASGIEMLAGQLDAYNFMANQAASETAKLTDEQKAYNLELAKANQTLDQYQQNQQIGGQNLAGEHRDAAAAIEAETEARENGIIAMQAWLDIEQQIAGNSFAAGIDVDANAAMTETWLQAQELRVQAVRQEAIEVERLQAQYAETYAEMQSIATQATDTLDSVFRAIVGNTDAIASQSQAVTDWAEELIGAEGTWAQIDDLLTNGAITLDEYTAAQQAYNQIAAANVSIQEDVLSIQAQLAPVVATATDALAQQMDQIANGSTDAQLFALGMMDAATSAQALDLATAYLGDRDTFGPMIEQAATLNPMLAQILEEMGLISYNPATGQVELLGVDESMSDLELLTSAMEDLDQTLATLIAILQDDASTPISEVSSRLDDLNNKVASPTITVIDNASASIRGAIDLLNSFDGRNAYSTITTEYITIASERNSRGHGGIAGYATGGVVAEMAEWGPELLHFPNGGVALARNPGIYTVPAGTLVDTAPATAEKLNNGPTINVTISGNVYGIDDLERQLTRSISDAWVQATRMHERSYGAY